MTTNIPRPLPRKPIVGKVGSTVPEDTITTPTQTVPTSWQADDCPHRHGDRRRYQPRKCHTVCRCVECRRANTAVNRRLREERAAGIDAYAPVEPVIEHINMLSAARLGCKRLSAITGIHVDHLRAIATGRYTRLLAITSETILAVTPEQATYVDCIGTVRRIQALVCAGFRVGDIAGCLGWTPTRVSQLIHRDGVILARTAEKVTAVFDELRGQTGGSPLAMARAKAKGWHPIEAWSEATIDDPTAEPYGWDALRVEDDARELEIVVERFCAGRDIRITTSEQENAAFRMLHSWGWSDGQIGARFGKTVDWALKHRQRHLPELAPQPTRPSHRMYLKRLVARYRGRAGLRSRDEVTRADARTALADLEVAFAAAGFEWPALPAEPHGINVQVEATDLTDYDRTDVAA